MLRISCWKPATLVVGGFTNQVNEQDKWLSAAGYNAYNIDIAFESIVKAIKNAHISSTSKDCVSEKAVLVGESELAIDCKDHQSQENQLPEDLYEDYIFMMTEKAALQEKLNEIKKVIETHESAVPASCVKQIKRIIEE